MNSHLLGPCLVGVLGGVADAYGGEHKDFLSQGNIITQTLFLLLQASVEVCYDDEDIKHCNSFHRHQIQDESVEAIMRALQAEGNDKK